MKLSGGFLFSGEEIRVGIAEVFSFDFSSVGVEVFIT